MKVFSVTKFIKSCRENEVIPYDIIEALRLWAKELDGKNEEELKTYKLKIEEDWLVSEEEQFDDVF